MRRMNPKDGFVQHILSELNAPRPTYFPAPEYVVLVDDTDPAEPTFEYVAVEKQRNVVKAG